MKNVASPVTIWLKDRGNTVKDITVSRLSAYGVYRAAASVESWMNAPIEDVEFCDVSIQYTGAETADPKAQPPPPQFDSRPLPAWGFYAKNVHGLNLRNVRLTCLRKDRRRPEIYQSSKNVKRKNLSIDRIKTS